MRIILCTILLSCFNCFEVQAAPDCIPNIKSIDHHIVKTKHTVVYPIDVTCKPLSIEGFEVIKSYEDPDLPPVSVIDYQLNWSNESHDLWHVAHYEVRINEDDNDIRNFTNNETLPVTINDLQAPGLTEGLHTFEVRACSVLPGVDPVCGDWQTTETQCDVSCTDNSYTVPQISISPIVDGINDSGDFQVSWSGGNYPDYELQRSVAGGAFEPVQDDSVLSKQFENQSNDIYAFQVRNRNGNIYSKPSSTIALEVKLEIPTFNFTPSINTTGDYTVSWLPVNYDTSVESYRLLEKAVGDSQWILISDEKSYSFEFKNQTNFTTYEYKVKACRADNNCSKRSDPISVEVELESPVLHSLPPESSTGNYKVSWVAVDFDDLVVSYQLEEQVDNGDWYTISNEKSYEKIFYDQPTNSRYSYQVRVCREDLNCSEFSPKVTTADSNLEVLGLEIFEDINTSRRVLKWELNPNIDLNVSGITHYKVKSLVYDQSQQQSVVLNSHIIDANAKLIFSTFSLEPDSYQVQACIDNYCGPAFFAQVDSSLQGLTRPIDALGIWDTSDPDNYFYKFKFKYPDDIFMETYGKPEKFIITPNFGQPDTIVPIEVDVLNANGNCEIDNADAPCNGDLQWWYTTPIPQNLFIGRDFSIAACRDDIGCGANLNVRLGNPIISEDIETPEWSTGINPPEQFVNYGTDINLLWNGSVFEDEDVDYIEVTEKQPVFIVLGRAVDNSNSTQSQVITYYVENPNSETETVVSGGFYEDKLERLVRGDYEFSLKACKRDRIAGDTCSSPSATLKINLERNEIQNSSIQNPSQFKFIELTTGFDNVGSPEISTTLVWNEPAIKPDYYKFHFGARYACGNNGITSIAVENEKNNKLNVQLNNSGSQLMNTVYFSCKYLPNTTEEDDPNYVQVSSCFEGIGCHNNPINISVVSPLETSGTATLDPNLQTRNSTENTSSPGGPGDLRPGGWWNPKLTGTGWHFYWASELRYPSVHESYGETYDLIGVWLNYQLINGVWSPSWILSHLKIVDDRNAQCNLSGSARFHCAEFFEGDLTYMTRAGGVLESKKLGRLQLYFENGEGPDTNQSALLKLDIDSNNGILTGHSPLAQTAPGCFSSNPDPDCMWIDDNGNLNMPIFNIDQSHLGNPALGDHDNDINHYSGIWSAVDTSGAIDTSFSFMVDIINDLEFSAVLFYDENGVPIWGQSDTCEGNTNSNGDPNCLATDSGPHLATFKTINSGFDPLHYSPNEFWTKENNFNTLGQGTRTFKDSDVNGFNDMKMWVDLYSNSLPGRTTARLQSGTAGNQARLIKSASFHDIRFFINDQPENHTLCDPNYEIDGQCNIRFAWFTDDDFPDIKPYFRKDGGLLTPLEDLCELPVQESHYVEIEYLCDIYQPGDYVFELRKPSYVSNNQSLENWVKIAESKVLEIYPCTSDNCAANTYTPLPEVSNSETPFIGPDADTTGNGNDDGELQWNDLPNAPKYSEKVGATKGNFNVTSSGAASFTIPILTAPAGGGLQPQLAISYNSQGSRGPMGMGWSVSGYSVVSRCAQTFEQDFVEGSTEPLIQAVTFTDSDRFCVDGQRLMLVAETGDYGDDGAEYRTEIDNITKYFSKGVQGSGPQCFEAWHKDGSITLYGDCKSQNADDSSLAVSGLPDGSALMWAQSRFTDDRKNFYTNHYHSNVIASEIHRKTVEFYLDEIKYSDNENTTSNLDGSVKMVYENMPAASVTSKVVVSNYTDQFDPNSAWRRLFVKVLNNSKKLVRIDSKFGNDFIRSYKMGYNDSDTANIGVLTSVQECASNVTGSSCLNPTTFEWGNTNDNTIGATSSNALMNLGNINDNEYAVTSLDANGDGHDDFYVTGGINQVYLNNPDTNTFTPVATLALSRDFSIADVNADGYPDFTDHQNIYLWNGSGYDSAISIESYDYDIKKFSDVNGDGLVDAIGVKVVSDPNVVNGAILYVGIFTNRYDQTHGDPLGMREAVKAAFSTPQDIIVEFDEDNLFEGYESSFISGYFFWYDLLSPPEIKNIISIYDSNNDGVSEILVEFEKDDWCQDRTPECTDAGGPDPLYTSVYAELHLQQDDANNYSYKPEYLGGSAGCEACMEIITAPTVADIDGDGKLEKCYVEILNDGSATGGGRFKCGAQSLLGEIRQNNLVDFNGDGYLDVLYSPGNGSAKWQVKYTQWNNGIRSYSNNWTSTDIKSGNAIPSPAHLLENQFIDKNLFIDINNDSLIDHLFFKVDRNTDELKIYSSMGQNNQGDIHSKDKIKSFTNGFGESWGVEFGSMSNLDIYSRENDSYIMWFGQSRSPVFDYISSMPLVAVTEHSMPAWDIDDLELDGKADLISSNQSRTEYHYKNAKLQAGGRGFLGFGEFSVFDTQTRILNQSKNRQDFPFTGLNYESNSWYVPVVQSRLAVNTVTKDLSQPCWVDDSCGAPLPVANACITKEGLFCPSGTSTPSLSRQVDTSGATLLSSTEVIWDSNPLIATENWAHFVYKDKVYNDTYELNGGGQLGSVVTSYEYIQDYGFLEEIVETAYQGTDSGNNWAQKKITYLDFQAGFEVGKWIVDRVKMEKTINQRPGVVNETRRIDRVFDVNALLEVESYKGTSSVTRLRTITSRNSYGQIETESLSTVDAVTSEKKNIFDTTSRLLVKTQNKLGGNFVTTDQVLQFNQLGLPEITQNAQGLKTYLKYDAMGKLFFTIDETGAFSQITYHNGSGNYCATGTAYHTIKASETNGVSVAPNEWNCYDQLGRVTRTVTQGFKAQQKIYVDQQYDISGRLLATSTPQFSPPAVTNTNHWNRMAYDETGREILNRKPFSPTSSTGSQENLTTTFYKYDGGRNLHKVKVTNAHGNLTRTFTNILGEVKLVVDGDDQQVRYEYDARGNKTGVDGPLTGEVDKITTTYDEFDQIATINDPDLGFWRYQYNALGQLKYQRDAKGNCTQMEYDQLGRVYEKWYFTDSNSSCTTGSLEDHHQYTFDITPGDASFGQLVSEVSNASEKAYSYDALGRIDLVISSLTGYGLTRSEQTFYDTYGRVKAAYDAGEQGTLYHYNDQGHQSSMQGIRTGITYQSILNKNAFGHITKEVSGNGIHTYRQYDVAGRMALLMSGRVENGSDVQYMSYEYDAVGNMTRRSDSRFIGQEVIEDFEFDAVNRLTRVDATYTDQNLGVIEVNDYAITYDAAGRRSTLKEGASPSITYSYDANHIHGVESTTDGKSYDYDAVGNQTLSDGRVLEYTSFNKAKRMSNSRYAVEYSYGANNEKLTRKDIKDGDETLTWYVGNVEIITKDWQGGIPGSIKSKRYLGDNTIVTHHGPEVIDIDYMHKDHLGSTQVISRHSELGYNLYHLSYDAFGKNRATIIPYAKLGFVQISSITNKGFTGQDHVGELNLINFKARMYDPNLGMMLQADTIVPDGPVVDSLNRYAYVFNNPLSYSDPSGHLPLHIGFDPWYDLRRAAENAARFKDTMRMMGMNMPAQRFMRKNMAVNPNNQNGLPAGVNEGSMGNGDVAGNQSINENTINNENIMASKRNNDGSITLSNSELKKVKPRLIETVRSDGKETKNDFLLSKRGGKRLRDLSDINAKEHCSAICTMTDSKTNEIFYELNIHTNNSHVACYTQGTSCSSGYTKMKSSLGHIIEIHSHGINRPFKANYVDQVLGDIPKGKRVWGQSLNSFSDQDYTKEGYLSGENGVYHQAGKKTEVYIGDYEK